MSTRQFLLVAEIEDGDGPDWLPEEVVSLLRSIPCVRYATGFASINELMYEFEAGRLGLEELPADRWIPVEECLPAVAADAFGDQIVTVLVCNRNGVVGEALYRANRPGVFEFLGAEVGIDEIGGWRALPPPPTWCRGDKQ